MKHTYDEAVRAHYVALSTGAVARTVEVACNVMVDLDADGNPVGVELFEQGGGGRVFLDSRLVQLGWFPRRGRHCNVVRDNTSAGRFKGVGVGPLYLGLGSRTPAA